jgi:hypothetical protein
MTMTFTPAGGMQIDLGDKSFIVLDDIVEKI